MTWIELDKIAKLNGKCFNRYKWKWCPFWRAKHTKRAKVVVGYKCALFDEDKTNENALPECNTQYGRSYEGLP